MGFYYDEHMEVNMSTWDGLRDKTLMTYAHLNGLSPVWFHICRFIWSLLTVASGLVCVCDAVHGVEIISGGWE